MRSVLVEALRLLCESDRAIDALLSAGGCRRRFYSTKGQDRWVVDRLFNRRRGGYFVEVGGGDGRTHSNTYVLERDYNWTGVVIEANPYYIPALRRYRTCHCVQCCVDSQEAEIEFFQFGFVGGIVASDTDNAPHKRGMVLERHRHQLTRMQTASLQQVLESVGAPAVIDYLSIDVEGAEHRVLESVDFDRFRFEALTIERPTAKVHRLLRQAGYILERTYRCDGFYVSQGLAAQLEINELQFDGIRPKSF
jgi:FkbM family methyltransferase